MYTYIHMNFSYDKQKCLLKIVDTGREAIGEVRVGTTHKITIYSIVLFIMELLLVPMTIMIFYIDGIE